MSTITNAPLYVWTTPDYTTWTRRDRLILNELTDAPSSMGRASFRIVAKNRLSKSGAAGDTYDPSIDEGIAVSTDDTTFDAGDAVFIGNIETITLLPIQGVNDALGSLTAVCWGETLKKRKISSIREQDISSSPSPSGVPLDSPPPFNIRADQGQLIGNAVLGETVAGVAYYQLATATTDLGTPFTRQAVVNHILRYCWPSSLPPVILVDTFGADSPLIAANALDSWDISQLSIQEALDLLISNTVGVSWMMLYDGDLSGYIILVIPMSDQLAGVTPTTVTLQATNKSIQLNTVAQYNAVEVIGDRIITCGTVSTNGTAITPTLINTWSTAIESAYTTGAPSEDDAELNKEYRSQPQFCDVYSVYGLLPRSGTNDFACKGSSGNSWSIPGATVGALCPWVDWDGTTASISTTDLATPNLATATLWDKLPWFSGVAPDGTDNRTAEQKLQPKLLEPMIFYSPGSGSDETWTNLLNPTDTGIAKPSLSVEPNGPNIRITYEYPEVMALNHWDSVGALLSDRNPDNDWTLEASDWKFLVATVALPTDQRIDILNVRDGATDDGRKLTIYRPDFQCWIVKAYTVLGCLNDLPQETTADQIVRNDWPYAQALADQASDWAFMTRNEGIITVAGTTRESWMAIGTLIGTLEEQQYISGSWTTTNSYVMNTVVSGYRMVPDPVNPYQVITTVAPQYVGKATPGLKATHITTTLKHEARITELEAAQTIGKKASDSGSGTPPNLIEDCSQTSHGFQVNDVLQYNGSSWAKVQATGPTCENNLVVVSQVNSPNSFYATKFGSVPISGHGQTFSRGDYFLSPSIPGKIISESQLNSNDYRKHLFTFHESETTNLGIAQVYGPNKGTVMLGNVGGVDATSISGATDGQALTYNGTTKMWGAGTSQAIYGKVLFDWSTGTDMSQVLTCNSTGGGLPTGAIQGWIDSANGFMPTEFGDNVWYELESLGTATRNGSTRPIYAIKRKAGNISLTSVATQVTQYGSAGTIGSLGITTTISGGAGLQNYVYYNNPNIYGVPPAGYTFDLYRPVMWDFQNSTMVPAVQLDFVKRKRLGGRATTGGAASVSIDFGESFTVWWNFIGYGTSSGTSVAVSVNYRTDFTYYYPYWNCTTQGTGFETNWTGGATPSFAGYGINYYNQVFYLSAGTAGNIVSQAYTSTGTNVVTANLTQNGTTGKITGIALAWGGAVTGLSSGTVTMQMIDGGKGEY